MINKPSRLCAYQALNIYRVTLAGNFENLHKEILELDSLSTTSEPANFSHLMGGYDAGYYGYLWSLVYAKDLFTKFGLFDENLIWKADRELWSRLINRGINIGTVESPVAYYRSHDKQWSKHPKKLKNNKRLTSELKKLIEIRKTNLSGLGFLT